MELSFQCELTEAGCDEAGRGCLAGPVFAAAVILPPDFFHPLLDDSKKMSPANRDKVRKVIQAEALAWAVAQVSAERIDEINILNASLEAMSIAVGNLAIRPQLLLVDGNIFRSELDIPHRCVVGGDGKYMNIAAASVLAKTHRDEHMEQLAAAYPQYGFERNKGYPTKEHRQAIALHGIADCHRRTFGKNRL